MGNGDSSIGYQDALAKIDDRLEKLENGKAHPIWLRVVFVGVLGIVPPITSVILGHFGNQREAEISAAKLRLQEQETKSARMLSYLKMAIDPEVPFENRRQLLHYMERAGDETTQAWAREELGRIEGELEEATKIRGELEGRFHELAMLHRDVNAQIDRLEGKKEPKVETREEIDRLRAEGSRLEDEMRAVEQELEKLGDRISDAPRPWLGEGHHTREGRWVVELTTRDNPSAALSETAKVTEKLADGKASVHVYQHDENFVIAVGTYDTHSAASKAADELGGIFEEDALIHSLDTWCPHPEPSPDDAVSRCR